MLSLLFLLVETPTYLPDVKTRSAMERYYAYYTIGDGVEIFDQICTEFLKAQKKSPAATQRAFTHCFVTE